MTVNLYRVEPADQAELGVFPLLYSPKNNSENR
jgi:hypothetical protein